MGGNGWDRTGKRRNGNVRKTFAVIYIGDQCVCAAMTHRAIESRAIAYCSGSCQKTTAQSHRS